MSGWGGVVLLILFLPFLVSLLGTMTFAFMAFVGTSAALVAALVSLTAGLASGPPNPPEETRHAIMLYGSWLAAWVFAVVGICRKRRKRNQFLRPVRSLYLMAYRDRLRGKDRAYFDWEHRHN
jgi:uncharacterized membrane protein YccC